MYKRRLDGCPTFISLGSGDHLCMWHGRLLALLVAAAWGANAAPNAAAAAIPDELLVRFDPSVSASERADIRQAAGTPVERALPVPGAQLVRAPDGDATAERAALERSDAVLYAEPNFERSFDVLPNDTHFAVMWGLHNTGQTVGGTPGTPDVDIDAPEAWDVTTGGAATTVAVVDSGVDGDHPDLQSQMWRNPGESGAGRETNGFDDDQNGYVDDYRGWDWVAGDGDPDDANGHGTHVAGTIGARGNNGIGVAGVSWGSKVMPLRALDADGNGTVADVVDAYAYAAAEGAPIVNASLGATGFSFTEYDTLRNLPNTLFVVAAGNDGVSNENQPHYPCSYNLANIVCVAAGTNRDLLATFSNYGATSVDLAAPGRSVASTWAGGGYSYSNGTSMASPHVAGAAALVHSHFGGPGVAAMRNALLSGVDQAPAFAGKTVTGGRLNVRRSLVPDPPPAPAPPPAPPAPQADRAAPQIVVAVRGSTRLRNVVRRGLRTLVRCSEACRIRVDTYVGRRTARRFGISTRGSRKRIGSGSARLTATGTKTVVVRLSRAVARRLGRAARRGRPSVRLQLRTRATDLAGNRRNATRTVRLR
jgi:subtilisin family serine protease